MLIKVYVYDRPTDTEYEPLISSEDGQLHWIKEDDRYCLAVKNDDGRYSLAMSIDQKAFNLLTVYLTMAE